MTECRTSRFICRSRRQTQTLAANLAPLLLPGDLLGLSGELGAGKTTFIQGLVLALPGGDQVDVSSPTFAITNLYRTRPPVYHLDFYRLQGIDDLESTGYWDFFEPPDAVIVVEWSDRIPQAFHQLAWQVHISFGSAPRQRVILITAPASRMEPIEALVARQRILARVNGRS